MKMFSFKIQTSTVVLKINLHTAYQLLIFFFVDGKLGKIGYVEGSTCLDRCVFFLVGLIVLFE